MRTFSYEEYYADCIEKGEPVYPWAKPCDGMQVVGPLEQGTIVGSENATGYVCECLPEWEVETVTPVIAFPKKGKDGGKK